MERHSFAVFDLGMTLRGFALHFGRPEDLFSRTFNRPVADMRLAHYPSQTDPRDVPGLPPDAEVLPPVISGPYLVGRFSDDRQAWTDREP